MKGAFFENFKKYLLNNHEDKIKDYIPYYETLLQIQDELTELLNDTSNHYWDVSYEEDKFNGYTNGSFLIILYNDDPYKDYGWQSVLDYMYKIELLYDDRMWGYCDCEPNDEGYNPVYNCCGNGCDWSAPSVNITKIIGVKYHAFNGVERDIWELEKGWLKDGIDHEEEIRNKRLEEIENSINRLAEEKKQLEKLR